MRAARDDLRDPLLVQRRDVLLGVRLEDVLVAHPPRGVAGAGLTWTKDRKVDACLLQELRGRLRRLLRTLVERRRAPNPVEILRRRVARFEHAHAERLGPGCPLRLRLAPR